MLSLDQDWLQTPRHIRESPAPGVQWLDSDVQCKVYSDVGAYVQCAESECFAAWRTALMHAYSGFYNPAGFR